MRLTDLHELPKVRDSWSYIYIDHGRIDKEDKAISVHDQEGVTHIPCSSVTMLMLGPGSTITHAAILTLTDNGCLVSWCGEEGVRFYASGMGETRSAHNLLTQAKFCCDEELKLNVVRRLYQMRFAEPLDPSLTLQQIRGMEGVRVRSSYYQWLKKTGVPWNGRSYNRGSWKSSDPVNRALSTANACLYGICHAAIVSLGYSPGLGFIHTGKQLSFVYDIADLYKMDITVPAAFRSAASSTANLERSVRHHCRDLFKENRILERIVKDISSLFDLSDEPNELAGMMDEDAALPGTLWDPSNQGGVQSGIQHQPPEPEVES